MADASGSVENTMTKTFLELGCCSEKDAFIANLVYTQLKEEEGIIEISYKYSNELKQIYFTGKREESGPFMIIFPIFCEEKISLKKMEHIIQTLCPEGDKKCCLGIVSAASTLVIYEISKGIANPPLDEKSYRGKKKQCMKPSEPNQSKTDEESETD